MSPPLPSTTSTNTEGAADEPADHAESPDPATASLRARVAAFTSELIAFRRDLHMHPELGREEFRTTGLIKSRLERAGLKPRVLPTGTGVICDIRPDAAHHPEAAARPILALRADIDALPVPDAKDVPYRSRTTGQAHACGHDVHTAIVLGAGLVLAELAEQGLLSRPVRLIFQPAEEKLPGGALDVIAAGGLEGVGRILAVHCDPKVELGRIGWRIGPITSACDRVVISLDGPGGHTARPHLTTDLIGAVAKMATDLPAVLRARIDPRAGLSLVWGRIESGRACNAIPQHAEIEGTVRCLELDAWHHAPEVIHEAVEQIAEVHGAKWELGYHRGVPPVVNEADSAMLLREVMAERFGADAIEDTTQSLGGEDFSWYLEKVPGAMARLGVRSPDDSVVRDIHHGMFDVDERCIPLGAELFVAAALASERRPT